MDCPVKILFILKLREGHGLPREEASSGLLNSARFVVAMLVEKGVEVKLVQVNDNNDIDREVYNYKPTHVVIEAFWVVPEKFEVLRKLHPKVKWVIRAHSEIPFIANEGIAINWLIRYSQQFNVLIAANSERALTDFRAIISAANPLWSKAKVNRKVIYLPNYYPVPDRLPSREKGSSDELHIGCFGAIRPLKNQLFQAVAAIRFAEQKHKVLHFHINGSRTEQGGERVLKNLRDLFAANSNIKLVEHQWMTHADFKKLLSQLDVGMQVTFSETFNIVSADMVSEGIPIVISPEIRWANFLSHVKLTDSSSIVRGMGRVTGPFGGLIKWLNLIKLRQYVNASKKVWLAYFCGNRL